MLGDSARYEHEHKTSSELVTHRFRYRTRQPVRNHFLLGGIRRSHRPDHVDCRHPAASVCRGRQPLSHRTIRPHPVCAAIGSVFPGRSAFAFISPRLRRCWRLARHSRIDGSRSHRCMVSALRSWAHVFHSRHCVYLHSILLHCHSMRRAFPWLARFTTSFIPA